jgi:hypothetical protein
MMHGTLQPRSAMPEEQIVLRLVKDSDPESFVSVTTDHGTGRITHTRFFTEEEVRKDSLQAGMTKPMIDEKLRVGLENLLRIGHPHRHPDISGKKLDLQLA